MKTPYFPIYANDDLADASCLSLEEYGAYTRLRCYAWKDDPTGTLPDDDDVLSRYAGVNVAKWQEMRPAVMRLFTRGADGRWHHSGLRQAFEKARQKSKAGQANIKKRWDKAKPKGGNTEEIPPYKNGNSGVKEPPYMSEVISQKSKTPAESSAHTRDRRETPPGTAKLDEIENLIRQRCLGPENLDQNTEKRVLTVVGNLNAIVQDVDEVRRFLDSRKKPQKLSYFLEDFRNWRVEQQETEQPGASDFMTKMWGLGKLKSRTA